MRRNTPSPATDAGLMRLYAALVGHSAYPIGPTVLQNQAPAEGAADPKGDQHSAGSGKWQPEGSCVSSGSPAADCRSALVAEEDARRALGEDALRVALMAEQEAEADAAFWGKVWDMVAVFVGTLALLAGVATWAWLLGGLGR